MSSYTAGTTAILLVLLSMMTLCHRTQPRWRDWALFTLINWVGVGLQYQVLFVLPALYLTLAIYKRQRIKWLISGLVTSISVIPFIGLMMRHHMTGIGWNAGINGEFALESITNLIPFLITNTWVVVTYLTRVVPEGHVLALPLDIVSMGLCLLGVYRIATSTRPIVRQFGVFCVGVMLTWVGLIVMQKLALSPTRHSLILLPILAIVMGIGVGHRWRWQVGWSAVLALCLVVTYPAFSAARQDPFDPQQIQALLDEYDVDLIISMDATWNLYLMPSLDLEGRHHFSFDPNPWIAQLQQYNLVQVDRILMISHRMAATAEAFETAKRAIQGYALSRDAVPTSWTDYRVHSISATTSTDQEGGGSAGTQNGANGYFVSVLIRD